MANTKISGLTAATTPLAGTEVLPVVQSGSTKQVSVANLTAGRAVSAASLALTTSPLPATSGGTDQSSYAVGDLLYASTTTALSKLADVATGNALISGGVGVAPSWGKIGLTTHVSGTLPTANGGTNLTSFTNKGIVYASSTSALATSANLGFDGTNFTAGKSTLDNTSKGAYIDTSQGQLSIVITTAGGGNQNIFLNRQDATGTLILCRQANNDVGSISVTATNTAFNTSSDYRLKNIIGPVTNSGVYIDSLEPVEGTWKRNGEPFVGLIAHKTQEVSKTQIATGEKDAVDSDGNPIYQGMDYSSAEIIANLIAEIQSLRKRMAAMEKGIA